MLTARLLGSNFRGPCSQRPRNSGISSGASAVEYSPPCVRLGLGDSSVAIESVDDESQHMELVGDERGVGVLPENLPLRGNG